MQCLCKSRRLVGIRFEAFVETAKKSYSTKPKLNNVSQRINLFAISLMAIPFTTFCLGSWQVKRRKWKLGLIEELKRKTTKPPVPLPEDLEDLKDMEYQSVIVKGKFDHSREILITPRSKMMAENSPFLNNSERASQNGGGLLSSSSGIGSHVITPFQLEDREMTILVNRGWIQKKKQNSKLRVEGQIDGTVELVGIVRKSDKRAPFMPKNRPELNQWHNRDIENMAHQMNCEPVFLDAKIESSVPGGPIGGQTKISLRNEHLSYIFTWYTLSILTAYLWYLKFVRVAPK